jgi:hypothetical protein
MTGMTTMPALDRAKWAFTTRRVDRAAAHGLSADFGAAAPGDLLLAEVILLGQHKNVQLAEGRPSALYPGDLVVLAVGDRYAPDQFEAVARIDAEGAEMIAGGGIAGQAVQRHQRMADPTRLRPIGLLTRADGRTMNVGDWALPGLPRPAGMTVIGVVGASMNSGKTTATAALAHGLNRGGVRAAAIKATGTGAFGDYNTFVDAGAAWVGDFTDAGMATTYRQPLERILRGLDTLLGHAAKAGCRVAVVELADGVFQQETAAIIADPILQRGFDGFMMAAGDALSVVGGAQVLGGMGIRPFAVSGLVSRSPLAVAEAIGQTGLGILTREQLCDPSVAVGLLAQLTDPCGMAA